MLDERDKQLDAEENASGQQSIWRGVYNLMRCPSPSCHLGPHCWQDPHGKKKYKLRTHHLKRLIAYVEKGGILQSHDDVPDIFREELYMEERQRLESQRSKSNKMVAAQGSCPPININFIGAQPSFQPQAASPAAAPGILPQPSGQITDRLNITGPRDLAVREYSAWQETNIIDDNLKAQFRQACDVTLANGLDLEQIHEDQDPTFFTATGIARRFVRDIGNWARNVRRVLPVEETD